MEKRNSRLITSLCAIAATFFFALPSLALDFTVHGYDLGERIELTSGRRVWTAEFDVSLETVADHVASFCVDLDTYIGVGSYPTIGVYDAATAAPGPSPSGDRNFAWAGHVMTNYGASLDSLVSDTVSRDQAITGVQAAIWEGLYQGAVVNADSLSAGAREIFDMIVAHVGPLTPGGALIVDLPNNQDQVISNPVPEPSAALVFGLGTVLVGSLTRRR